MPHFAITRAQREALFRVFQRDFPSWVSPGLRQVYHRAVDIEELMPVPTTQWRRFRSRVVPGFDGSGCIMIAWRGMMLGIERDGYTHS